MNHNLYESIYSDCNIEGLKIIRSLPEEKYSFVLLIGINEDKKNYFYQEILNQSKLETANSSEENEIILESTIIDQKGAYFCIDEVSSENNIIWCNTENIMKNNYKDHLVYLKNIAKYCSKIILFTEYTDNYRILRCENFLNELLVPHSLFEDIDILLCIDMVNPSLNMTKNKNNIEINHFKILKSITKNFNIEYIENDDDDLDTSCLFRHLRNSQLASNLKKTSFANFLENIDEPPLEATKIFDTRLTQTFEEDINERLGLNLKSDYIDKYNESQNHSKHTEESTISDYYNQKEKNYLNYLNDHCKSEKDLENWKLSKENGISEEKEVLMKVYKERKNFFNIQKDLKTFLEMKKVEISEYKKRSSENIESLIKYCLAIFQNSFFENQIPDNLFHPSLSKIVKDFIYSDVENTLNNNDLILQQIIDGAIKDFKMLLGKFKSEPYNYDVDSKFETYKKDWSISIDKNCSVLKNECNKTLEIRIEEMEILLETIKSNVHHLDFNVMECINCCYFGSMYSLDDIQSISMELFKTDFKDAFVYCSKCDMISKVIDFKNRKYEFEIDSSTNKVKRIRQLS